MLSADFSVVEGASGDRAPQSLWIGVRPVYYGNEPSEEPMVQVCYQKTHMTGPLAGPVWITPEIWRELNAAVEWRLRERGKMHRGGKAPRSRRCYECGKKLRFGTRLVCRRCWKLAKKKDKKDRRARRTR
jgi:hypothetical protein